MSPFMAASHCNQRTYLVKHVLKDGICVASNDTKILVRKEHRLIGVLIRHPREGRAILIPKESGRFHGLKDFIIHPQDCELLCHLDSKHACNSHGGFEHPVPSDSLSADQYKNCSSWPLRRK